VNPFDGNNILSLSLPDLFGLIEATSNSGAMAAVVWACVAAWVCVARSKQNATGKTTTTKPIVVSNGLLLKSSLRNSVVIHASSKPVIKQFSRETKGYRLAFLFCGAQ
jgi:hypothetical protein